MLFMIVIALIVVALLPPIIMFFFPAANLLMRVLLTFTIFTTIRGFLGQSALTLVVSGVLIYILVIKWGYLTASLYIFFYVLMMFNFFSVVIWGLASTRKQH